MPLGRAFLAVCLCAWRGPAALGAVPVLEPLTDEQYTVEFTLEPPAEWPAGAELRILLDQTDAGEGHALVLRQNRCFLARTQGAEVRPIGRESPWQATSAPIRGVVQRRSSRLVALLDHRQVATAQDAAYHGGSAGWMSTDDRLQLGDFHVQPVALAAFTDDFVREGDSLADWDALTGTWLSVGPEGAAARPDLSANPFSFRGEAGPDTAFALAAAGDWFWSDYRTRVAAKAQSVGAMGIAAYVQDAANFLLFRWTSTGETGDAGRMQLIRVQGGGWTVLAEAPGGFRPDRWYRLGLAACAGRLEASVDDRVVLSASETAFGQGRVGLFAQDVAGVSFDDAEVWSTRNLANDFAGDEPGWWTAASGAWECRQDHLYGTSTPGKVAEATVGDEEWRDYTLAADVKTKTAKAIGLTACRTPEGDCYRLRWEAGGRLTLEAVLDGVTSVLAESNQPLSATQFHRIALHADHGRLAVDVDGRTALEAADTRLPGGPAGLLVVGPGEACFDNATVTFTEARPPDLNVTAQFTREETMQNWVDPARQWRRADDGVVWYDMPLFGDFTLWLPEVDLAPLGGVLDVIVAQEPAATATPMRIAKQAGASALTARVAQGETVLAEGQTEATGVQRLRIVRQGSCLSAWLGDRPLVACRAEAFAGRRLGLRQEGIALDLAETTVSSRDLVDVTFSGAPTEWEPQFGVWQVTDRWPCAPGWSWFGGSRHESPLLWSKATLEGDQVLEFWAGMLMDLPKEPGYSHASDINAILCGDGANLCSGYSFILAGDNNTRSKMLKGNTVLAENPNVKFENPISTNFAFHRHWFDIRIEKTGNHLKYSVDDRLVAEWDDPDVLDSGRVGFWSFQNNGLLLARARMAAERVTR